MNYYLAGYALLEPLTEFTASEENDNFSLNPYHTSNSKRNYIIWEEYTLTVPSSWAWEWTNTPCEITNNIKIKFNLSNHLFNELQIDANALLPDKLFSNHLNFIFFKDKNTAQLMYSKYFKSKKIDDIKLLGIYCPETYLENIILANNCQFDENLRKKIPISKDENIIGFDIINFSINDSKYGINMRYHCDCTAHIQYKVNNFGLIDNYEDALLVIKNADYTVLDTSSLRISSDNIIQQMNTSKNNWIPWTFSECKL